MIALDEQDRGRLRVGDEPTAFVATAGSGAPVIALLAEYDALPGLSQIAGQSKKQAVAEGTPGHGCAHNLLGTASVAAAVAANRERAARKLPGTIQLFGTPADALVLFDHAMALMREHILPTARIHRMIRDGGSAPNIIADHTLGEYWLRDTSGESVNEMLGRLKKAADGAALGTETRAKVTLLFSTREPVPNDTLNAVFQRELDRVGPPRFDDADQRFARAMQKELGLEESGLATTVMPFTQRNGGTASSDIGEVSAILPLAELNLAARPIGTSAHHWAQTTCAAHPVGYKGMAVAAKVLAASTIDVMTDPALIKAAREEFVVQTKGKPYVSPLPPGAKPVAPH